MYRVSSEFLHLCSCVREERRKKSGLKITTFKEVRKKTERKKITEIEEIKVKRYA